MTDECVYPQCNIHTGVVWITFKGKTGDSIRNNAGTGLFGSFKENNCFGNEIFILVFTQESAD